MLTKRGRCFPLFREKPCTSVEEVWKSEEFPVFAGGAAGVFSGPRYQGEKKNVRRLSGGTTFGGIPGLSAGTKQWEAPEVGQSEGETHQSGILRRVKPSSGHKKKVGNAKRLSCDSRREVLEHGEKSHVGQKENEVGGKGGEKRNCGWEDRIPSFGKKGTTTSYLRKKR